MILEAINGAKEDAYTLWCFHNRDDNDRLVVPSSGRVDFILALGCANTKNADRAVELRNHELAHIIICAGGRSSLTRHWRFSEGATLALRCEELGIPRADLIVEEDSTNTGDNIGLTREKIFGLGYDPRRIIFVHMPYMGLRTWATARKRWPELGEAGTLVTCVQTPFEKYPLPFDRLARLLTDQTLKLPAYMEAGFQVEVDIPTDVWDAAQRLDERFRT